MARQPVNKLNLYARKMAEHTVTFRDWDGQLLKVEPVAHGDAATAPEVPHREGHTSIGWDADYTQVKADLTVTALCGVDPPKEPSVSPAGVPNDAGGPPQLAGPPGPPGLPSGGQPEDSPAGGDEEWTVVWLNGERAYIGKHRISNEADRTMTVISVDPMEFQAAAERYGASERSVLNIPVEHDSDIFIAELNGEMIKWMEQRQAVLEIQTSQATYVLPAVQIDIDAVSAQLGSGLDLAEVKLHIEIANLTARDQTLVQAAIEQAGYELVAPPLRFRITAVYGEQRMEVMNFSAYVERTMAVDEGNRPARITTGVVVGEDGLIHHVPTRVKAANGRYYAVLRSLTNSTYAVIRHSPEFADIAGHWAAAAIYDLGSRTVINGTGQGRFEPDRAITRAEFASILGRALGIRPQTGPGPFVDIGQPTWYSGAVNALHAYGLVRGYEDGTFRPEAPIRREEAMVMIAAAMEITGLREELGVASAEAMLSGFIDSGETSAWDREGIACKVQAAIADGRGEETLASKAAITRAEVAVMLQRLLRRSGLI